MTRAQHEQHALEYLRKHRGASARRRWIVSLKTVGSW